MVDNHYDAWGVMSRVIGDNLITAGIMVTAAILAFCISLPPFGVAATAGLLIMIQEQDSTKGGIRWNN